MGPGEALVVMTLFVSAATTIVLRGPLGRALADRIAGRAGAPANPGAAAALDHALGELEELKHRLAELEERQDFAERLLTRERERSGLPPGGADRAS